MDQTATNGNDTATQSAKTTTLSSVTRPVWGTSGAGATQVRLTSTTIAATPLERIIAVAERRTLRRHSSLLRGGSLTSLILAGRGPPQPVGDGIALLINRLARAGDFMLGP